MSAFLVVCASLVALLLLWSIHIDRAYQRARRDRRDALDSLTQVRLRRLILESEIITTQLKQIGDRMESALVALKNQVAANTTVISSALTLIQGLREQLQAALDSPDSDAAIQQLVNELQASDIALSAAVAANTPGAPATPPADPAPEEVPAQ